MRGDPADVLPVVPHAAVALLERQGGLARRSDLHRCGIPRRGVERLISDGALRTVTRDVVSARTDVPDDEAVRAAVVGLAGVASHCTAARLWGIGLLDDERGCEVTVGRDRSRAAWPGVKVHRRDLPPEDVRVLGGIRVTSPVRTVLDLSLVLPLVAAVVSADAALRAGVVSERDLRRGCAALRAGQQRSRAACVVRQVDPRSGSTLESVFRLLVVAAGLPRPQTQYSVVAADGRLLGRVDFAWPEQRLVVETDGYAFHADRASYRADRRRINALVLDGWRVLRFSWEDVLHDPDSVVASVRAALLG